MPSFFKPWARHSPPVPAPMISTLRWRAIVAFVATRVPEGVEQQEAWTQGCWQGNKTDRLWLRHHYAEKSLHCAPVAIPNQEASLASSAARTSGRFSASRPRPSLAFIYEAIDCCQAAEIDRPG